MNRIDIQTYKNHSDNLSGLYSLFEDAIAGTYEFSEGSASQFLTNLKLAAEQARIMERQYEKSVEIELTEEHIKQEKVILFPVVKKGK